MKERKKKLNHGFGFISEIDVKAVNFPSNCSLIMSFWKIRVYENPGNGDLGTVRVNVVLNLLASEWYDEK